jgi:hypothetical protein
VVPTASEKPYSLPHWIFNNSAGEGCLWKGVAVKPMLPAFAPDSLRQHTSVLEMVGALASPAKLAVEHGCYLTAKQVKAVCVAHQVQEPAGTGKPNKKGKRSLLKKDWCAALILHFFPDADEAAMLLMLDGMMGKHQVTICPEEVLLACDNLDLNECDSFGQLKAFASKIKQDNDFVIKARLKKGRLDATATTRKNKNNNKNNKKQEHNNNKDNNNQQQL